MVSEEEKKDQSFFQKDPTKEVSDLIVSGDLKGANQLLKRYIDAGIILPAVA